MRLYSNLSLMKSQLVRHVEANEYCLEKSRSPENEMKSALNAVTRLWSVTNLAQRSQ